MSSSMTVSLMHIGDFRIQGTSLTGYLIYENVRVFASRFAHIKSSPFGLPLMRKGLGSVDLSRLNFVRV
ncbi:hypothetical protein, partial [Vibrio nigripulchritudo]|uniref:hypothetical protein n=1 Tax=Vibrio nigripulchritudo TaxID=28173 RepID=UPI001E2A3FE7